MKPENAINTVSSDTAGRLSGIMKYPAALCGTVGMTAIVAESVCSDVPFVITLLFSLFWCTGFYLLLRPKKGTVAGVLTLVAGCILITAVLRSGDVSRGALSYLASGAVSVWNLFMETIDRLGYVTLPTVTSGRFAISGYAAIYFTSFVSAAVFCLSTRKNTRLFVVSVFAALVLTPLFIYNLPEGNAGISLIIAALAALAAMRISEKRTGNSRMSGYSGLAALLASAVLLSVPAAAMKSPWKNVGGLSDSIEYLREVVTRIAEGDTTVFDGEFPNDYIYSRSVTPGIHRYTGREIMNVYSETDAAIYLRTWIGGEFTGTEWEAAQNVAYGNYTADELTRRFVAGFDYSVRDSVIYYPEDDITLPSLGISRADVLIVPKLRTKYIPVPTSMLYGPFSENRTDFVLDYARVGDGILMTKKNLSSKTPIYADVIIPAPRNSTERGNFHRVLERYGVKPEYTEPDDDRLSGEYTVVPSSWTNLGMLVREHYLTSAFSLSIDIVLEDFLESSEIAGQYFRLGEFIDSDDFMSSIFNPALPGYSDETDRHIDRGEWEYTSWLSVKNGYRRLYRRIGTTDSVAADDIATAFSGYLAENYKYNIAPPAAATDDPVEEFLLNSKEGYCVQFATALTLMLRRVGFPARYAEGYIANEFREAKKGGYPYSCKVTDRKAHAWTEVWLDGFGWMVYEATPGFSGSEHGSEATTDAPTDTEPPTDTTQPPEATTQPDPGSTGGDSGPQQTKPPVTGTTEPPTTTGGDSGPYGRRVAGILTVSLAVIALAVMIVLLAKRSAERTAMREKLISGALDGRGDGKQLCDMLFRMLGVYGESPGKSELPSAFDARMKERFGNAAHTALAAAERQIYGDGMTEADKRAAGAFLKQLSGGARETLGFFRFVWYRHIVCVI